MAIRIKIGDIYQIPLLNGKYAFAQYVYSHRQWGYLMRVFDLISEKDLDSCDKLKTAGDLFPPIFVGLRSAVEDGGWKRVGVLPVAPVEFPQFRCTSAHKPGTYENWYLWNGDEERFIGKLPTDLRKLEHRTLWGHEILAERIEKGQHLFEQIL